ncbi:zinc finger, CCHC-type containing protein [Tanacetum coccineum]
MYAKGNNQGKGTTKLAYALKPKNSPSPKKDNLAKDVICHKCSEVGHWRRNCPQYLTELMKKKKLSQGASNLGIFIIKLYSFLNKYWVYDMGCGTHMCNTTQGLRKSRKLKPGALNLHGWDSMDESHNYSSESPFGDYARKSGLIAISQYGSTKKNAAFFGNSLISQEESGSLEDLKIIQDEDTHPSENTIGGLNEPTNYKATLLDPESDKWLAAMNVKMQSMKDNQVWDLVDLPPDGKTIGSKWLFKKKTNMDDNVHTYKSHLIAKGFTQTYQVDYEETFSPVTDIRAIKILIAIAAY